jgi:hypothetical protein
MPRNEEEEAVISVIRSQIKRFQQEEVERKLAEYNRKFPDRKQRDG